VFYHVVMNSNYGSVVSPQQEMRRASIMMRRLLVLLVAADAVCGAGAFVAPHGRPSAGLGCRIASMGPQTRTRAAGARRPRTRPPLRMQRGEDRAGSDFPKKMLDNLMEGKVGERGEVYVGLQFALVFLVIIAPLLQVGHVRIRVESARTWYAQSDDRMALTSKFLRRSLSRARVCSPGSPSVY